MTATDVEVESIEHLDFDHQPPCGAPDCDRPADYSVTCRNDACDGANLTCSPCLEKFVAEVARFPGVMCNHCGLIAKGLLDLIHVHPLH